MSLLYIAPSITVSYCEILFYHGALVTEFQNPPNTATSTLRPLYTHQAHRGKRPSSTDSHKCTMMQSTSRIIRRSYSASGRQMPKLQVHTQTYLFARPEKLHDDERHSDFSEAMWPKSRAPGYTRRCRCNSCHRSAFGLSVYLFVCFLSDYICHL